MKHSWIAITFILCWICGGCSSSTKQEKESTFEKAKEEQFDQFLSQLEQPYDLSDTLYTEMYIALKASKSDVGCGDTVIKRVHQLLEIDDNPDNQRHYLDALSTVYSMRNDMDNFWKTALLTYDTYPYDSFQRLSSYGLYYTYIVNQPDSASVYLEKAKVAALKMAKSDNSEDRLGSCIGIASILIAEGKDSEAKDCIHRFIETETNEENQQIAQDMLDDFVSFKESVKSAGQFRQ